MEIETEIRSFKIAVFTAWIKTKGGAEKQLLEWLKRTKHQVTVYTWVYEQDKTYDEFKNYNIKVLGSNLNKYQDAFIFRGLLFGLKAFTTKIPEDYALILIFTSGIAELISFGNKHTPIVAYCNTPLRATVKEDIEWNLKYRFKNPAKQIFYKGLVAGYKILEKLAWRNISFAYPNSNLVRNRITSKNLIPSSLTRTVYSGVNLKEHTSNHFKDYFLYVARYGMAKRQIELLKAWKEFIKDNKKYRLILVGSMSAEKDTEYFDKLKAFVEKEQIQNVEFKLNVSNEELDQLYSQCLAGLNVPFMEDFGLVPFEVLSYNKPLITVKTGGFAELLDGFEGIVWIDDKDDDKLIENITSGLYDFIRNENHYINGAKNGYEGIKKINLTWDNFAKNLDKELYIAVMSNQVDNEWYYT